MSGSRHTSHASPLCNYHACSVNETSPLAFHERHEQFIVSFAIYKRRRNYCLHGRTAAAARRRGAPVAETLAAAAERRRRPSLFLRGLPAGRAYHQYAALLADALALWWSVGIHMATTVRSRVALWSCAPSGCRRELLRSKCDGVGTALRLFFAGPAAPFSSDAVDLEPKLSLPCSPACRHSSSAGAQARD